jgi:hypothetical protein
VIIIIFYGLEPDDIELDEEGMKNVSSWLKHGLAKI